MLYADKEYLAANLESAASDYGSVEVWLTAPFFPKWRHSGMDSSIKLLGEALDSFGLKRTAHAAHHDLNLGSLNPAVRRCARKEIIRSCEAASSLGAEILTFHPGRVDYDRNAGIELLCQELDRIFDKVGSSDVRLCLENVTDGLCESVSQAKQILGGRRWLGLTLDVAHANKRGWDCEGAVKDLGDRIWNVHVSKMLNDSHTAFDKKCCEAGFIRALVEKGYGGDYVIEGYRGNIMASLKMQARILGDMVSR